jgi:hypothetical protein
LKRCVLRGLPVGLGWFRAPTVTVALPLTHRRRLEHKLAELGN